MKLSITNLNLKLLRTQYTMKSRATSRVNAKLVSDVSEIASVSSSWVDVMSFRFAPYIYIQICRFSQSRPSNSNSDDSPTVRQVVRAETGHHHLTPPIIRHAIGAATDECSVYKCSVRTQHSIGSTRADPFAGPDSEPT